MPAQLRFRITCCVLFVQALLFIMNKLSTERRAFVIRALVAAKLVALLPPEG